MLANAYPISHYEFGMGAPYYFRSLFLFVGVLLSLSFKFIREGRPMLLVAHGLWEQALAYILKRIFFIPYVAHVHEIYEGRELSKWNRILFKFERKALQNAEFLVFPHEERLKIYKERYALRNPLYFVPNCPPLTAQVSPRNLREEFSLPEDSTILLYLGGIGPGVEFKPMLQMLSAFPKLHFFIFGYGSRLEKRRLLQLSELLGVETQVHGLCSLAEALKWPTLFGADLFYCVYQRDGLRFQNMSTASSKFMEAMAAGLPVITNDTTDFKDFLEKYPMGVAVDPYERVVFQGTLERLLKDREHRKSLSLAGRLHHQNHWCYEVQFQRVAKEYQKAFQLLSPQMEAGFLPIVEFDS